MKKTTLVLALILTLLAAPAMLAGDSWTGWITDSHCGAKGAKAEHKSCAIRCAERDGKFVFYNTADEKIYEIDKQDLAKEHLGGEVVVTGELDGSAIKVESIAFKKE
ncbi:MAG TPA: DUF5818 domain-containing protein [Thermoanaerobaculia bacterium]|nr:DUF5818 domain-containing protein [Thermoanaerobaculia bacterium]